MESILGNDWWKPISVLSKEEKEELKQVSLERYRNGTDSLEWYLCHLNAIQSYPELE